MYFYELREGDEEIFSDLILVSDEEMAAPAFYELVQEIRARILDTYEEDSLIEAIAAVLEREHGFTHVADERLVASVNVSEEEGENYLVDPAADAAADYRAVRLEWDPETGERAN